MITHLYLGPYLQISKQYLHPGWDKLKIWEMTDGHLMVLYENDQHMFITSSDYEHALNMSKPEAIPIAINDNATTMFYNKYRNYFNTIEIALGNEEMFIHYGLIKY